MAAPVQHEGSVRVAIVLLAILLGQSGVANACTESLRAKWFGVPVWATDPNEGNTYGAMPILMGVCPDDNGTALIVAPSVTWNALIHYTGTLRVYWYPTRESSLSVVASYSTQTNRNLYLVWRRVPQAAGVFTDEAVGRVQRTIFARFFGLGPMSAASAESSFTRNRMLLEWRRGLNLGHHLNLGVLAGVERDDVEDLGVPGLPLAAEMYPDVPGMAEATAITWQGIDLRYDDRDQGEVSTRGIRADAWISHVEGLVAAPDFVRAGAQASGLWSETSRLGGAARASWQMTSRADAPFYDQSMLGGAFLLRGFSEGRFVARQAWTVELEQRVRLLTTHFFGVTTDWRVDPFVAVGQVFDHWDEAADRPQLAAGAGLRAFVHPSVLGRIDLASGGEGLKVYVEIGYPY
jgi:hypothetical protein